MIFALQISNQAYNICDIFIVNEKMSLFIAMGRKSAIVVDDCIMQQSNERQIAYWRDQAVKCFAGHDLDKDKIANSDIERMAADARKINSELCELTGLTASDEFDMAPEKDSKLARLARWRFEVLAMELKIIEAELSMNE